MVGVLVLLLVALWLLGFIQIPGLVIPNPVLFVINGRPIGLWDILVFILIASLIGLFPSPLREILSVALLLWVLSVLGIFVFAGLSSIILLAIIVGLVLYLLSAAIH